MSYLTHCTHEAHHIRDIVFGEQLRRQCIALFEHDMQHGARVVATRAAATLRVHRAQFRRVLFAFQPYRAVSHQCHTESGSAGGKHAVKPGQMATLKG